MAPVQAAWNPFKILADTAAVEGKALKRNENEPFYYYNGENL